MSAPNYRLAMLVGLALCALLAPGCSEDPQARILRECGDPSIWEGGYYDPDAPAPVWEKWGRCHRHDGLDWHSHNVKDAPEHAHSWLEDGE